MAATSTHKELTAHLRDRIKKAGIKACCSLQTYCGEQVIRVSVPKYDAQFTEDEQRTIRTIAQVNGLTFARGSAIDLDRMTNSQEFVFYMGYR